MCNGGAVTVPTALITQGWRHNVAPNVDSDSIQLALTANHTLNLMAFTERAKKINPPVRSCTAGAKGIGGFFLWVFRWSRSGNWNDLTHKSLLLQGPSMPSVKTK